MNDNDYPKISIVTVVYNGIDFLEETIISVINQTYKNIEYIIIDGGSTDGTIDIIKKYENKIAYWSSEPDKGIYDAMNKGIKVSTGDWFNFLNAGDSFVNNSIVEQGLVPDNTANSTIIYGDVIAVKENGEHIAVDAITLEDDMSIRKGMRVCHQSIFYHRDIMLDYDDELRLKSEWKHLIQVTRHPKFKPKKLTFPFVYYTVGGIGARLLKLNQQEYRIVFLDMFGYKEYIKRIPYFLFISSKRVLKRILKKCKLI